MSSAVGIGWRDEFAERDVTVLQKFIKQHPLGALITAIPENLLGGNSFPVLQTTFIPFVLDTPDSTEPESKSGSLGTLRGHIARKNPHAQALIRVMNLRTPVPESDPNSPTGTVLSQEVMILFNGPVNSYVTPSFYTATKPTSGKVVPTWNFSAVQAYGTLKLYYDPAYRSTSFFLGKQLTDLTHHGEEVLMGFSQPWKVSDAPASFTHQLSKAILGVEIKIMRLEGKWKIGQETAARDQLGTIRGFRAMGTEAGEQMAKMIEERGAIGSRSSKKGG
ncbi:uncharacterized protein BDR25DRAFT_382019 [Lindgomyces ingoldianus]|uniref:Uncharacterized protein n=1 Tax=Lindgomyces ingoldianus TaxID=673940 RepID=A0ACB6R807_9PLEO|nr:uncharacterized protein BDR25DRAFT_382019 [Lindgomyces ingoldianus]KAF2475185.1 hypothetical protein BDR25DRAFT_382019 [Lindgomyces ingoldianus]